MATIKTKVGHLLDDYTFSAILEVIAARAKGYPNGKELATALEASLAPAEKLDNEIDDEGEEEEDDEGDDEEEEDEEEPEEE